MHVRTAIRNTVTTLLRDGLANVQVSNTRLYTFDVLPAVSVYTRRETIEPDRMAMAAPPSTLYRAMDLAVECRVKAVEGAIDSSLDDLTERVETVLGADPELAGLAKWFELREIEIDFNTDLEQPIGLAALIYVIEYRTQSDKPDTAIT